ncbi:hypothetical protein FOZ60_006128 [Perkinsus olseni]|uniref:Uncharacterized protein n=1 Tax=Perkinsus olseni TaxID=32597 RepID=A0A7J6PFU7_PEROL|nr:hypothetical protein FOZ60_006128 [Perkinsus olseni]
MLFSLHLLRPVALLLLYSPGSLGSEFVNREEQTSVWDQIKAKCLPKWLTANCDIGYTGNDTEAVTHVAYHVQLPKRYSYSFEAFVSSDVLSYACQLIPEIPDEKPDIEEIGRALRRKANSRRRETNACTATDLMEIPVGRNKTVTWIITIELEMKDPKMGFMITALSTSFGKKYTPKLKFNLDINRLWKLERKNRVTFADGKPRNFTQPELTDLCYQQLLLYNQYIRTMEDNVFRSPIFRPPPEPFTVRKLLMWLTTNSSKTLPFNLPYTSAKHDLSVWARPPDRGRYTDYRQDIERLVFEEDA